MTIETKYNIGDEVWVISDNKAQCLTITKIRTISHGRVFDEYYTIVDASMHIEYCFSNDEWVKEKYCFPTKEELLKSL